MKTVEEMYEAIRGYEIQHGESFLDHFDGQFNQSSFIFWCLGKEYIDTDKFDAFHKEYIKEWACIGCELLYGDEDYSIVSDESDDWEEPYKEAMMILAEFLVSNKEYQKRVEEFLKEDVDKSND